MTTQRIFELWKCGYITHAEYKDLADAWTLGEKEVERKRRMEARRREQMTIEMLNPIELNNIY